MDGLKLQTSGVNNINTETALDTFTDFVRSLCTKIPDAVATSSFTDRHTSQNNQRGRSDSRDSNRYRSPSPGPRRNNNFSNFKKPNQPNERNTARDSNSQKNNCKVRFSDNSKNNKRDRSSSSQRSDDEKFKHCGRNNHSRRECKACFNCGKIVHFRHECRAQRQNLNWKHLRINEATGNSKSLKQTECLNSVMDDKSVFVRAPVCENPLDAVCDTSATVSCLSPKVFVGLPPKIQSSLKPCSKRQPRRD